MRAGSILAAGCAAAIALVAGTAEADPRTHDGFFLRLGPNLGPAMVSYSVEGASADADISGFTFGGDLLLGGTLAPGFVLGGGLLVASTSNPTFEAGGQEFETDGTMLLAGAALFGQYYFDPTQGFHAQALLGYAALDFVSPNGASGGNDPSGVMLGIGAGYDFWVADEWSIGPFARLVFSSLSVDQASFTYIYPNIGAAFTLH
jgi:outer membrane autotransporter protein